jgi:chemotaxis protein histidine kinase CheA/CheY-like chemotaxis protein
VRVTSEQSPEALEVFRDEALEHLQTITAGIAQLETTPGDVPTIQSIRRAMHTLKGAAGMMGFVVIQQLAHVSEDLLDRLVDGAVAFTPMTLALLLDTSETLDRFVSATGGDTDAQQETLRALSVRYAQLTGGQVAESGEGDALTVRDDAGTTGRADDATAGPAGAAGPADLSVRLQLRKLDDLVNLFGELLVNRSILEERLDRLGRFVNDTVVVSERLREVGDQLESRFEAATLPSGRGDTGALTGGATGREQQGPPPPRRRAAVPSFGGLRGQPAAHTSEFDELELDRYTEFHRLSRGLSEGVADVVTLGHEMDTLIKECLASFARENRLSSELQDRLLKARLVPLQSLVPRLYRTVRASALKEGKEIEFYAEGTETEVDRKVIEEVAGPMLHLVRNAVNHGIERPSAREMAGKPSAGSIIVSAAYEGNQVVIAVRDDGAGIDPERIRAAAVARGLIDAYTNLSDREAINLIFKPGVTTADTVTEESGRGVGLDVVRDMVARFRGTLEVDSSPGQGTVFTMKFPIGLQIARALLVKVGPQTLAIPMAVVDQIDRLERFPRIPGETAAIDVRGERYPVAHLASYLKLEPGPVEDRSTVLLVNAGRRRVALLVDGVASQQEIVSKPLGPHLRDVPGVAGAAVLGNGQVVLILELHELLAQQPRTAVVLPPRGSSTRAAATPASNEVSQISEMRTDPVPAVQAPPSAPSAPTPAIALPPAAATPATPRREFVVAPRPTGAPTHHRVTLPASAQRGFVLVVDDSPSVRRVVSNMLKANGWEVQTARDGMEALDVIARQAPAAVLLDIEMPRMDGYELMATVRSQEQYSHLPLIVLTSRAATKHQTRAVQLGADAYVVKPYQDEELLDTIATLVRARQG